MPIIDINAEKLQSIRVPLHELAALCPFGEITEREGTLAVGPGCRACMLCVNNGPQGLFEKINTYAAKTEIIKSDWNGVAVFCELRDAVHPVAYELIGKAKELTRTNGHPVYAVLAGSGLQNQADALSRSGADAVYAYDYPELEFFLAEPYANVLEDFIINVKPSVVLIGATAIGRGLAPKVAARLRTGLTADCTKLEMDDNADLIQIRPAFGGNIMASINTPYNRPQMATVRYKIFDAPRTQAAEPCIIINCNIAGEKLASRVKILNVEKKPKSKTISEADVIVAVGRGVKSEKDLSLIEEFAVLLNAETAGTRPVIEAGWLPADRQIGLSGRSVKPKLIITAGVSGSVQFKAGMENAELIVAINSDEGAKIFDISHYAAVGDLYDIIPALIKKIKRHTGVGADL